MRDYDPICDQSTRGLFAMYGLFLAMLMVLIVALTL